MFKRIGFGIALAAAASMATANTVSVNAAAAIAGNFGMQVAFDPLNNNNAFVRDESPNDESVYKVSFKMKRTTDANAFAPTNTTASLPFYVLTAQQGTSPLNMMRILVKRNPNNPTTSFHARVIARKDAGGWSRPVSCGNFGAASTGQTYEIVWKKATAVGANDGFLSCRREGVLQDSINDIDNDTKSVTAVNFGIMNAGDTATGSYFLDDFVSTRTE